MAGPWEEYADSPAAAGPWTEYDQRKKPAPPERVNTAEGMGALEKLLVGVGSSLTKAGHGLTDPFVSEQTRAERKAERELYAKHAGDLGGWGTAGEVAGDVAAYAPAALIPGGLPMQMAAGAAASGAMTPGEAQERAQAAGMGAAGAGIGNVLTRALGRLAKPIGDKTADVLALEARGVQPTFGQGMASKGGLSRVMGRLEEGAQSVPLAGVPIRNRRIEAGEQWQRATREAALPPGAGAADAESIDAVRRAFSDRYTAALQSERLPYASVQYQPDMRRLSQGQPITPAQRQAVEDAFEGIRMKYLQNPTPGVQPTAAAAHGVESELKDLGRRYVSSQDPAQQDLGRLFNQIAKEYGDTWRSQLQPDTARAIAELDRAYPAFTAIREAGKKVAVGQSGGVPENYTPSVLLRAGRQLDRTPNKTRYMRGEAAQQELAGQGQRVLGDKLGDSGTAERLGVGGLVGGAGWVDPMSTLGGGAALGAYGTRPVQNYLMGRSLPAQQQFLLELLRGGAPYGAAAGASQAN